MSPYLTLPQFGNVEEIAVKYDGSEIFPPYNVHDCVFPRLRNDTKNRVWIV